MRHMCLIVMFLNLAALILNGQQGPTASPSSSATADPTPLKVYSPGQDATFPELLSMGMPITQEANCKGDLTGKVTVAAIVDAQGHPHDVFLVPTTPPGLNALALQVVRADRFRPSLLGSTPVAVGLSVEVELQGCAIEAREENNSQLRLKAPPTQRLGNLSDPITEAEITSDGLLEKYSTAHFPDIYKGPFAIGSHPLPLRTVEAQFTKEARRQKISGSCFISLVVNKEGIPQNIYVLQSLEPGLDQNAMKAVRQYRFQPAMKDGQPVAEQIIVKVDFRLY